MRRYAPEGKQSGIGRACRIAHLIQFGSCFGFQQADQLRRIRRAGKIGVNGFAFYSGAGIGIIEGIVLHLHVGIARAAARGFSLTAVACRIVGSDVFRAIHQHNTTGGIHSADAVGVARRRAAVNLIAGGIHHVVHAGSTAAHHTHCIGTCGNRLRLERLQTAGIAHFIRQHAVEIVLNIDMCDGIQLISVGGRNRLKRQIARIRILAFTRLRNQNAIGPAGAMAADGKASAHISGLAIVAERNRTAEGIKTHRQCRPAGQELPVYAVIAAHSQIQRGRIAQRGQINANHAVHGFGFAGKCGRNHLYAIDR